MKAKEVLSHPGLQFGTPIDFIYGMVTFDRHHIPEVKACIVEAATRLGDFRFSGTLLLPDNPSITWVRWQYTNRSRFGKSPDPDQMQSSLSELVTSLKGRLGDFLPEMVNSPWIDPMDPRADFRLLVGLREGYELDAPIHTYEEVFEAIASYPSLRYCPAQVYSVGGGNDSYSEPVVFVYGEIAELRPALNLLLRFKQERSTLDLLLEGKSIPIENAQI